LLSLASAGKVVQSHCMVETGDPIQLLKTAVQNGDAATGRIARPGIMRPPLICSVPPARKFQKN